MNHRHFGGCRVAAAAATLVLLTSAWATTPVRAQQPGAGAQAPAPQGVQRIPVDSVAIYGTTRAKPADVAAVFGIARGDTITYRDIEKGIRRLYASGQYKDVQVYARNGATPSSPVTLVLQLEEQPYIADVKVEGVQHIGAGTFTDSAGVKAGGPLRPSRVAEAEAKARNLLTKKGFQVKKISHRLEPMPGMKDKYRLIFNVEEGSRVAIADIGFEGNKIFNADQLRSAMDSKPEGFLWFRPGTYDEEKVRKDARENIPTYYAAHGYIDASVTGDTLIVDSETGKGKLVFQVTEGPQYRLGTMDVHGNHRFPSEDLKKYFSQDKGGLLSGLGLGGGKDTSSMPVFDQAAFDKATDKVRQLYSNEGYLYAQVEPVIDRDSAQGHPVVNVSWDITEGQPAYVNKVTIAGNTFTHERIIRKAILLLPGDVYNEDLLVQSYRNIQSLGFFESPMPSPKIEPNDKGDVNITFNVKEKNTGSVNFGTAVGGGTGVAGFLGYDQPNLFGQAKSGHLRWEFGKYSNDLEASYTDPTLLGSDLNGTLSLFSTRDRFFTFSEGQRRRTGGMFRVGLPMPTDRSGRTLLFLGYSLARTTYEKFEDQASASLFSLPPGLQSTFTADLVRNTLDSPMFPTAGTKQEFQADFNGGILGGDARFQKYQITGQWYVPIGQLGASGMGGKPVRFTLGLTAQGGALFGNAANFPFERFWMGGVQFGIPLRGYPETTVTPTGYIASCSGSGCPPLENRLGDAFIRLSAEYAARINDNISLSAFYDAGSLYRSPSEIDPTHLLRGAGVGATIVTPFGPIGFDYGYGFDKDRPSWQFHFKFGQGF